MDTLTEQAESPGGAPAGHQTRQFVTFMAGGEVFAVDMAPVQEIIRVPQVVRVPLAPPTLNGLTNLRGKVLPIVSLRRTLGLAEHDYDDSARAIVIGYGQQMGFVVDRVASVVGVDSSQIEGVAGIEASVSTDLLSGLLKDVAGHPMIMVLDFERLMAQEFAPTALAGRTQASSAQSSSAQQISRKEDELHLVSFDVAQQEYAIAISAVQEIVQMPEHFVQVPRAQSHVLGLMTLRNRLLPLVSLRRMFGLAAIGQDERSRIVVVALAAGSVGIVVDNVNEVLRVPTSQVEAMPALLARDSQLAELSHICRLDEGRRLVSVMSTEQLFQHTAIREAMASMDQADMAGQGSTAAVQSEYELMVVFRLGTEEFGVPIANVQEIVRVPATLTHVPQAPTAVEGVINLRGAVLTVVDLRRRLGLDSVERNDGQRIIVLLIDGLRTGFIVDAVAEVLKVPAAAIEPAPRLSADQAQLLARMVNLEQHNRLLQLIEPQFLLQTAELRAAMAEAGHA
ncbi:chemotaxis protein CheW [Duganella qianjiadongensis]|uniref:Chemotaxis protein CheW n=1 Tax=Duganella qianjiadongensis TaxID=2692176 RepID=A0ABW9VI63_9BURK|nr:chemotaxis protein CheW [Duganella qianjiadongensis]MYM39200.1 chemotaxis protein CheW [Duganella qianjiadongensis]